MASGDEPSNVGNSVCVPEALGSSTVHVYLWREKFPRVFREQNETLKKSSYIICISSYSTFACIKIKVWHYKNVSLDPGHRNHDSHITSVRILDALQRGQSDQKLFCTESLLHEKIPKCLSSAKYNVNQVYEIYL